jgi:hypothetical protein
VTVLYESSAENTGVHCFDLREAVFFFEPNAANHPKTALVVDFPSHMKIFFVERWPSNLISQLAFGAGLATILYLSQVV